MAVIPATGQHKALKHRVRITREGIVFVLFVIALLVISLIQRLNLMTLYFSVSVTPLLAALWMGYRNLKNLELRIIPTKDMHAGSTLHVDVEVENQRKRTSALGLVVSARFEHNGQPLAPQGKVFLPAIPAHASIRQSCPLGAVERGIYSLKQANISSRFPFGFFTWERHSQVTCEMVVYPRTGRFDGRVPMLRTSGSDASQLPGGPRGTQLDQYRYLREYRIGDNPRHVHWRSSARRGELMVKEFEPDGTSPTVLLFDPYFSSETRDPLAFERMVSFVATICIEMSRQPGLRGILALASQPPKLVEGQGPGRWLHQALRELAAIQPTSTNEMKDCLLALNQNKKHLGPQIWILGFQSRDEYAVALATHLSKDGLPSRTRFQYLGATEIDKFFRLQPASSYTSSGPNT